MVIEEAYIMHIRAFSLEDVAGVVALWNREAVKYHYKPFTTSSFTETFIEQPYYDPNCMWVGYDARGIVAFASGSSGDDLPLGDVAGYITCVFIAEEVAQDEHYDAFLTLIERRFVELGKKQSELLFFNPVKLIWNIPGTPDHEHNNAPGISKDLPLYKALIRKGYVDRATQCGMYLKLGDFSIPEDVLKKEHRAIGLDYEVTFFDATKHSGLDSLLEALDNPQWQREVVRYTIEGVPLVVVVKQTKCVGFAGPIIVESNGRAFFCGIGVHPDHEGFGLGSVLFFRMVEAFQNASCQYISLFTGSNNPALNIYKKAGFNIVNEFSILRGELSHE